MAYGEDYCGFVTSVMWIGFSHCCEELYLTVKNMNINYKWKFSVVMIYYDSSLHVPVVSDDKMSYFCQISLETII